MNIRSKLTAIGNQALNFKRPLFRGGVMLAIGATLLGTILLSPNIGMMGVLNYSWLLFCGYFLMLLGLFEAVEALMAEELLGFLLGLQYALLDIVVGFMIDLNLGNDPARLALLISAFLIIRGLGRLIFANVAELEERRSISIGAAISALLGLLISLHWPTKAAWFMALSLSLEIALRGWAQMMVAFWLKARKSPES
jgi:uncharacterized membrane protein HdeD (DUF308 family)